MIFDKTWSQLTNSGVVYGHIYLIQELKAASPSDATCPITPCYHLVRADDHCLITTVTTYQTAGWQYTADKHIMFYLIPRWPQSRVSGTKRSVLIITYLQMPIVGGTRWYWSLILGCPHLMLWVKIVTPAGPAMTLVVVYEKNKSLGVIDFSRGWQTGRLLWCWYVESIRCPGYISFVTVTPYVEAIWHYLLNFLPIP